MKIFGSKHFSSLLLFCAILITSTSIAQKREEPFKGNTTPKFEDLIAAYRQLDLSSEYALLTVPAPNFNCLIIDKQKRLAPPSPEDKSRTVMLVMNGIHPGETDGIDASLVWIKELLKDPSKIADNVTLLIIPAYNIEGMVNRKTFTRCGQLGPEAKGFRADGMNLDLNRDFIKMDSWITAAFMGLFKVWNPDVFVDTHTSNGADYQYAMTLITTQQEKLGGKMAELVHAEANRFIYNDMKNRGWEMAPYVNVFGRSPIPNGYEVFIESPKYSTGFTALHHTLGFVAESHMLKPYEQRVNATYALLKSIYTFTSENTILIRQARVYDIQNSMFETPFESNFRVNKDDSLLLNFKGYAYEQKPSTLGDYQRGYYNRAKPITTKIPYFSKCTASLSVPTPAAYILPKQWQMARYKLQIAGVEMTEFPEDTFLNLNVYYLTDITHAKQPYEGHFPHTNIKTETRFMRVLVRAGDVLVPLNQGNWKYVMECLEPSTEDGFMAWNFFDPILNQKEGYSAYVFEEEAAELLKTQPGLKEKFETWKRENPALAKQQQAVLDFIYQNSPYQEKEYRRFPVYRLEAQ